LPSRKEHVALDRLVFGKTYGRIHQIKDSPSKWMGSKHRKALHDPVSNLLLALIEYPRDPTRAFLSAQLHDLVDFAISKAKSGERRKTKGRL
jgi:hypothetical protein